MVRVTTPREHVMPIVGVAADQWINGAVVCAGSAYGNGQHAAVCMAGRAHLDRASHRMQQEHAHNLAGPHSHPVDALPQR